MTPMIDTSVLYITPRLVKSNETAGEKIPPQLEPPRPRTSSNYKNKKDQQEELEEQAQQCKIKRMRRKTGPVFNWRGSDLTPSCFLPLGIDLEEDHYPGTGKKNGSRQCWGGSCLLKPRPWGAGWAVDPAFLGKKDPFFSPPPGPPVPMEGGLEQALAQRTKEPTPQRPTCFSSIAGDPEDESGENRRTATTATIAFPDLGNANEPLLGGCGQRRRIPQILLKPRSKRRRTTTQSSDDHPSLFFVSRSSS